MKEIEQFYQGRPRSELAVISRNSNALLHEKEDNIIKLH